MAAVGIVREPFRGWRDTVRLSGAAIALRVVADVGPRVVELRTPNGASLFHLREREVGGRGETTWRFRGGWRLWIAPERRATTYALDNAACAVSVDAGTVRVTGPVQPEAGIQKTVALTVDPVAPHVQVASTVTNVGATPVSYAPWTLAALRPGGRAFVPLDVGPPEAFDHVRRVVLWSYATFGDPRYAIGDALVELDHRVVVAGPPPHAVAPGRTSDESKIGVDARAGWAAYLRDRTLFVTAAVVEDGPRVDGGATLELYSSREFVELEHLGPLATIAPGAALHLREAWWLFEDVELPPTTAGAAAIRAALDPYVHRAVASAAG
jgi:hypothetical protein